MYIIWPNLIIFCVALYFHFYSNFGTFFDDYQKSLPRMMLALPEDC